MPRCFMAKKLKYPYQQWKSSQQGQEWKQSKGLGGSEGEEEEEEEDERQNYVEEKEQGRERECTIRLHECETPEKEEEEGRRGRSGSDSWGEGEEGRVPVLSYRAPNSPQGELFRPYCLKDPLEYKYGLQAHPLPSPLYRNLEELSTAQAILDLSSPNRADTTTAPRLISHMIKTEPHMDTSPPYSLSITKSPPCSLPGAKTTTYTYQAFFASDGRAKKVPVAPNEPRPKFTCSECGKHYATSSNLSRHRQTHRTLDSGNAKKCHICNKMYVSMPALSMHVLTHNLNHKCDVCGKAFSRPWLLQGHMRSHTGYKPYGCAHCGKTFADRSNLRAHMQTHSAFKNFNCKRCNKSFALKSYLNKHYESACFKDQPIPSLDTPPNTPSPSELSEDSQDRMTSPGLQDSSQDRMTSPDLHSSSEDRLTPPGLQNSSLYNQECQAELQDSRQDRLSSSRLESGLEAGDQDSIQESPSLPASPNWPTQDCPSQDCPSQDCPPHQPHQPHHIIHIPTPIFPYSKQLIKV